MFKNYQLFWLLGFVLFLCRIDAKESESPSLLKADQVEYDSETEVVTATGDVQITQDDKVLRADVVTYNKKTKQMHAHGHVWFKDETGEIYFSEYADFSDKMENGFAKEVKGILLDNGRLAARTGQKFGNKKMIFQKGLYSPCDVCRVNPDKAPLWQLKANKIIHNKTAQIIEYHHARMEWWGVPFFYTPYFRHADPSVKRKSGILKPEYGTNSDLGQFVSIPIYFAFDQNYDMTLVPIITSQQGMLMTGEYRHRFTNAEFKVQGSFTSSRTLNELEGKINSKSQIMPSHDRWHVFLNGRIDLSDEHLLTIDINRASDTTYIRRYPLLTQKTALQARQSVLTSFLSLEQFKNTSYGSIKSYVFQNDNPKRAPFIIPIGTYIYETLPGRFNETWSFEANALSLHRINPIIGQGATDMDRLSFYGGFQIPYVNRIGTIWNLKLNGRWDYYNLDDYRLTDGTTPVGRSKMSRFFPQVSLVCSYPWVQYRGQSSWILEPVAMVTASTHAGNSARQNGSIIPVPNEDSTVVVVDQTTLFLMNRFYGIDRVDSGHRFVYGGYSKMFFPENRKLFLFIGQSVRLDDKIVLPNFSGESKKTSQVITSLKFVPCSWLELRNNLMLDRNKLDFRISESNATLINRFFTLSGSHVYLNKAMSSTTTNTKLSQLSWNISTVPYKNWSFNYAESLNISPERNKVTGKKESGFFSRGVGVVFENECFKMKINLHRTAFQDRDLKPATTVLLILDFKNIGSINPLNFIGDPFNTPGGVVAASR